MAQYILAHDLGTSGNKATLYSLEGELAGSMVCDYPTHYPFEGAVEQDPADWWRAVCRSTRELLSKTGISPGEIACVSFSAIMMGCLIVDAAGEPLRNMLIWADTRSAAQEKRMLEQVSLADGYRITGHRPSASYSAAKLLWIKDNEPELYGKAHKMIHAKDYIIHRLTGAFVTDYSDASGTNLLDIGKLEWSRELVDAWGIHPELLPDLHPSTDIAGKVTAGAAKQTGLLEGTPVVIGGGDGSCASVGAGAVEPGDAYNVIGTSSWISVMAEQPYLDPGMRTFNWVHLNPKLYAPSGTMQAAGYSYSWYRDTLCGEEFAAAREQGISAYKLLDAQLADSPPGAKGLLYLPYILGERSPHWNHNARGAFVGMGISTTKADFTRAVLEGVGYNLKIILDILESKYTIERVMMIGGGAKGRDWLTILSGIWQKPLQVPRYIEEATSMGAAVCGGVGIGAYKDFSVAKRFNAVEYQIQPDPAVAEIYGKLFDTFRQAYSQLVPVYDSLAGIGK